MGMLPSASVGSVVALFEPIHGSYPEGAGLNIANPNGAILSAAMLLETSFGLVKEAKAIRRAVEQAMEDGILTIDIRREKPNSTTDVGDYVANLVASKASVEA